MVPMMTAKHHSLQVGEFLIFSSFACSSVCGLEEYLRAFMQIDVLTFYRPFLRFSHSGYKVVLEQSIQARTGEENIIEREEMCLAGGVFQFSCQMLRSFLFWNQCFWISQRMRLLSFWRAVFLSAYLVADATHSFSSPVIPIPCLLPTSRTMHQVPSLLGRGDGSMGQQQAFSYSFEKDYVVKQDGF